MSKSVRNVLGTAAPLVGLIPGVGLPLAIAAGAAGGLLKGGGLKGALVGGLGGALTGGGAGLLGSGLNSGLGLGLAAGGAGEAGVGGTLLGAGAGGLAGGGKGALIGGGLGGAGSYLGSGGASELIGGTAAGRALGLATPEGGSLIGGALGSSTAAAPEGGGFFSSLLSGNGAGTPSSSSGFSPAESSFLNKASISSQGFSPAETSFLSKAGSSLASPSLSAGVGGGASTYGGSSSMGTLGALLGGANSLNANDKAQKDLLDAERNATGVLEPYLASGQAANTRLSDLLGTSGNTTVGGYGDLTKPFTPTDLQNDPGYQFQLKQGNQALDRKAAAGGNYFSGAALKAAQDYGTGLADTTYNNAYARDAQNKQQQYGMFSGQSGAGQGAAGAAGNIYENIGSAKANAGISSSNILNQTLSSLLNGSGAKRLVGYTQSGQPIYA